MKKLSKEEAQQNAALAEHLAINLIENINDKSNEINVLAVQNLVIHRLISIYVTNYIAICKKERLTEKQIEEGLDHFIKTHLTLSINIGKKNAPFAKEYPSKNIKMNLTKH